MVYSDNLGSGQLEEVPSVGGHLLSTHAILFTNQINIYVFHTGNKHECHLRIVYVFTFFGRKCNDWRPWVASLIALLQLNLLPSPLAPPTHTHTLYYAYFLLQLQGNTIKLDKKAFNYFYIYVCIFTISIQPIDCFWDLICRIFHF